MQESSYRYETYSVLFNNIKGLLIILVVLGHLIEEVPLLYNSAFGSTIHKLIYSFHMEAFISSLDIIQRIFPISSAIN